jgi:hypothetical protein
MATAVYLVHYQRPRKHYRHAVRVVQAPVAVIRKLYRHLHEFSIDALAQRDGIGFLHVRTWMDRGAAFEKKLKNQKHHSRLCPVCNPDGYVQRTSRMLSS